MRIPRPRTRAWFTALKLCDPPVTCITASVRPCIGRMLPISSGSHAISGDADCRLCQQSVVAADLEVKLNTMLGWRDTHLVYGVLQLASCFPLHAVCRAKANYGGRSAGPAGRQEIQPARGHPRVPRLEAGLCLCDEKKIPNGH